VEAMVQVIPAAARQPVGKTTYLIFLSVFPSHSNILLFIGNYTKKERADMTFHPAWVKQQLGEKLVR